MPSIVSAGGVAAYAELLLATAARARLKPSLVVTVISDTDSGPVRKEHATEARVTVRPSTGAGAVVTVAVVLLVCVLVAELTHTTIGSRHT